MGWACSYVPKASMCSNAHPILASLLACSFPLMFVWALTLWSVVVCVRACNILTIDSSIFLSGWLICNCNMVITLCQINR